MPPASTKPRWVFFSTAESIEENVPSVTALIETFLAVATYWALAIRYETYLLIIASVAVAPLVLLRSDASVTLGVRWFKGWERNLAKLEAGQHHRPPSRAIAMAFAIVFMAAAIAGCVSYVLTYHFGFTGEWWARLLLGAGIGWVSMWLSGAFATALGIAMIVPVSGPGLAFAVSVAAVAAAAATGAMFSALGVVCASVSIAVVRVAIFPYPFPGVLGFAPGVFLVSLTIRFAASCRHPWLGLRALPTNFRRLTLCTSPAQTPALIPGLEKGETRFEVDSVLARIKSIGQARSRQQFLRVVLIDVTQLVIWFLPGWLYRFTLKSTAWYWWMLAFMGRDLRRARDPELLHWSIMGSLWAKTTIALALVTILAFAVVNVALPDGLPEGNPLLTILGYLLLADFSSLRSWQVLPVVVAALAIAMVYLTNDASWRWRHAARRSDHALLRQMEWRFGWIELISRFRFLLFTTYLLIVGVHMLLYFNSRKCWAIIRSNVEQWAIWMYADRLPTSQCVISAASL